MDALRGAFTGDFMGHPISLALFPALKQAYEMRLAVPGVALQQEIADAYTRYVDAMKEQTCDVYHALRQAAKEHTLVEEGTLEVDDHATVSFSAENLTAGYVQAWLWVNDEELTHRVTKTPQGILDSIQLGHQQNTLAHQTLKAILTGAHPDLTCNNVSVLSPTPATLVSAIAPVVDQFEQALHTQCTLQPYRDAAELNDLLEEGTLELDSGALVSRCTGPDADEGAYVQVWLWVELDE